MKAKCGSCGRNVGVREGTLAKHREGRSKPGRAKPVCLGAGKKAGWKPPKETGAQAAFSDAAKGVAP
jgi:hypothetical protein